MDVEIGETIRGSKRSLQFPCPTEGCEKPHRVNVRSVRSVLVTESCNNCQKAVRAYFTASDNPNDNIARAINVYAKSDDSKIRNKYLRNKRIVEKWERTV